jgi:hypothetical protein
MPYFAEILHLHSTPDGFPVERLDRPYPTVEAAVAGAISHIEEMNAEAGTATYRIVDEDGIFVELADDQRGVS